VVTEAAAAAAPASYSGHLGVRSSFPPVSMMLAVGCDYDSVPHVWFREKSWKRYMNILKHGQNSKYPSNYPRNFCPAMGSIGSFSLRFLLWR